MDVILSPVQSKQTNGPYYGRTNSRDKRQFTIPQQETQKEKRMSMDLEPAATEDLERTEAEATEAEATEAEATEAEATATEPTDAFECIAGFLGPDEIYDLGKRVYGHGIRGKENGIILRQVVNGLIVLLEWTSTEEAEDQIRALTELHRRLLWHSSPDQVRKHGHLPFDRRLVTDIVKEFKWSVNEENVERTGAEQKEVQKKTRATLDWISRVWDWNTKNGKWNKHGNTVCYGRLAEERVFFHKALDRCKLYESRMEKENE